MAYTRYLASVEQNERRKEWYTAKVLTSDNSLMGYEKQSYGSFLLVTDWWVQRNYISSLFSTWGGFFFSNSI